MITNIVNAYFQGEDTTQTRGLYQWDYGQVLRLRGLALPASYEVHFSNVQIGGESVTQIGNADGVNIPDALLTTGRPVFAWVFLHAGENDGETMYAVQIPVTKRPQPTDVSPTPEEQSAITQAIAALNAGVERAEEAAETAEAAAQAVVTNTTMSRVTSLDSTRITPAMIEVEGIPQYVSDVSEYSDYGITDTGWYIFCRITAPSDVTVSASTTITGAAWYIATLGADHIDVAVRFDVAALSQRVVVNWGAYTDDILFKATDLAIRNLDYRTTFYVYDIAPYARWEYALTADAVFAVGKAYYTEEDGEFSRAEVETVAYVLTADATFAANKTYYTEADGVYTAAEVTAGEAVPEGTYYEATTVSVPAYYVDAYALTTDATFVANKAYYTEADGVYTLAEVTAGEEVPPETYYEHSYAQATGTFTDGVTYYTKSDGVYTAAEVTAGEAIPAYYNHRKVIFEGMTRNVTYRLDEPVDCPQEYVLPEIEDETHGAWFEIRLRHTGAYSSNLIVPDGVKVATEHTQAETVGINMVDLHYTSVDGEKLWRFLNTHSTIPA